MIILKNENCIFFDCDSTLVMWPGDKGFDEAKVKVLVETPDIAILQNSGISSVWELAPHKEHIDYLKKSKKFNKNTIVVWSAGGWDWALNVVKALELEEYVDAVMAKPVKYVDDLPCKEFMGERIYKEFKPE